MKNRNLVYILSSVFMVLMMVTVVFADNIAGPPETVDVTGTLEYVTNWAFAILLVFAAIMLIVAGLQFITAGGDSGKLSAARDKVLYALLGVAVAFASRGLVSFVQTLIKSS